MINEAKNCGWKDREYLAGGKVYERSKGHCGDRM